MFPCGKREPVFLPVVPSVASLFSIQILALKNVTPGTSLFLSSRFRNLSNWSVLPISKIITLKILQALQFDSQQSQTHCYSHGMTDEQKQETISEKPTVVCFWASSILVSYVSFIQVLNEAQMVRQGETRHEKDVNSGPHITPLTHVTCPFKYAELFTPQHGTKKSNSAPHSHGPLPKLPHSKSNQIPTRSPSSNLLKLGCSPNPCMDFKKR